MGARGYRSLRFFYQFVRSGQDVAHEREYVFEVSGERRSATVYLPDAGGRRRPAWILLQGVTIPGRHHAGVRRLARALAAAGHLVITPEVPAWTDLRVDPHQAEATIRAARAWLAEHPVVDSSRVGLMGFSVAATWALEAIADELQRDLRAVVGIGGYADLRLMIRAMVVGEHEWRHRVYHYRPDPYGRWIIGANLLPALDDTTYGSQEDRRQAGAALHRLAYTAGRNGAKAGTPVFDDLIRQLRTVVPAGALPAWDLLAPTSASIVPNVPAGLGLADALAAAGRRAMPELEPSGWLADLAVPITLMHGRGDTLIPFSETLRLAAMLPPGTRRDMLITRIFGHAKFGEAGVLWHPVRLLREVRQFMEVVSRMLQSVER